MPSWQTAISAEGPAHPGSCGENADICRERHDRYDAGHGGGARDGARGVEKDLHVGITRWCLQCLFDVVQTEQRDEKYGESQGSVYKDTDHDGAWHHKSSVFNLFRHLPVISLTDSESNRGVYGHT